MTRRAGVLILTHGRPDRVYTVSALQKHGYTGPWWIVIDNEDEAGEEYKHRYGDRVIVFDRAAYRGRFDLGDNLPNNNGVVFARNAAWDIARDLGLTHFVVLDDDYTTFDFRVDDRLRFTTNYAIKSLDKVFDAFFTALDAMPDRVVALCMSQSGDFIGNRIGKPIQWRHGQIRKAMNVFFLRTDRRFNFLGRMNEDVTAYVMNGMRGLVFLTTPIVSIMQKTTQTNPGGLTELYRAYGTYAKSFYTLMMAPSTMTIAPMGMKYFRMHHRIKWDQAVPKIIREHWRKVDRPEVDRAAK